MAGLEPREQEIVLSPRETAHLRARDRKRTTRMVVDNAGVKRILEARRNRAAEEHATAGRETGAAKTRSGGR